MSRLPHTAQWGPIRSLLCLAPLFILAPLYSFKVHYALPAPVVDPIDPVTSLPQLSEARMLAHAKYLSEDIGYRTVGTVEHALGDAWILQQAEAVKAECERVVRAQPGRKLQCEVWHQQGSGAHRFDIMGKRLYKTYVGLTNTIVRVSDGTEKGKEHALLVNAHVDSTLPSPGAADDALPVGVMLECLRVLVNTPDWSPTHALVFLFNNAEESLQDGSQLFSTQHPIARTVRAVINLEAAGTTGPELLFQASSEQMVQAYAKVPRPYGSIIANEIFSSGILLSDTDFRQFELYLNVTGLDMAIVGNSYLYHMRKDLVENIEPGVAQHMAENVLALLKNLASPASPLPELAAGYTSPRTVFYDYFGFFLVYSFSTAKILYSAFFVIAIVIARATYVNPAPAVRKGTSFPRELVKGSIALAGSFVGAIIGANVVAFLMDVVLGKSLSWFSSVYLCMALYGPAALAGALTSQIIVGRVREQAVFSSLLLSQAFVAIALQLLNVGSSGIFFLCAVPLSLVALVNPLLTQPGEEYSLWSYALGELTPLVTGTKVMLSVLDFFVPLTGRIGQDAPAEFTIASIVALTGAYVLQLLVPFVHRFPRRALVRAAVFFSLLTGASMAYFSTRSPFDAMHQKRMFVIHMENVTSSEQHLHIATADGAPGFHALAERIADRFSVPNANVAPVTMNDWNSDWNMLYPFSAYLTPYKFELPVRPEHLDAPEHAFTITAVNDTVDAAGLTRSLTLVIRHPGIIWTTIAFDAQVISWSLDDNPPRERARHHIKEASFHGHDEWSVDMLLRLPPGDGAGALRVDFVGIHEKAMWPAKRAEKALGGRAMVLFEEFDAWVDAELGGTVDATLLGCVGGVAVV